MRGSLIRRGSPALLYVSRVTSPDEAQMKTLLRKSTASIGYTNPVARRHFARGRLLGGCIALALVALGVSLAAQRLAITFDDDPIGAPPDGFFFAAARQASPGTWEVMGSGNRRHLSHTADPSVTLRGISVAGFSYAAPEDIRVTTRLHLADGDRAGGVIRRYRDPNNFYFMSIPCTRPIQRDSFA